MSAAHFQRGLLLYQQGRHQEAVGELRLQLGDDSEDSLTHGFLALSLNELEQYAEATEHAERAIHLAPDEAFGHFALARVMLSRHRLEEARAAILEAIRLNPYDADYFGLLAHLELGKSRWREALTAANQGLELDPEHGLCTNLRAQALVKLGDRAGAAAAIGEALARRPDDAYTHANQGWALLHAGQPTQALDHFREALRLEPEMEWARAGIVEALKARNFIYRWMLAWFLWMSRLTPGVRWGLVIGGYFGSRFIRQMANNSPPLAPFLYLILFAYFGFVLLTWLSPSFFNLLLRLDRFGRYALSADQVRGANVLAGCLLVFLGCLVAYLMTGDAAMFLCTIFFGLITLPASAIYVCDAGWPRLTMAAITIGLLTALLFGLSTAFLADRLQSRPLQDLARQIFFRPPVGLYRLPVRRHVSVASHAAKVNRGSGIGSHRPAALEALTANNLQKILRPAETNVLDRCLIQEGGPRSSTLHPKKANRAPASPTAKPLTNCSNGSNATAFSTGKRRRKPLQTMTLQLRNDRRKYRVLAPTENRLAHCLRPRPTVPRIVSAIHIVLSMSNDLTHFDDQGASRMVDVGDKPVTSRLARASGRVAMQPQTLARIQQRGFAKGDVLEVARLAGIMAAKRTGEMIPLCHPLPLDAVTIGFSFPDDRTVAIEAEVRVTGKTGVEMEALAAVSVTALTIYDMCKAIDRGMTIDQIRLEEKSGGRSGHFVREGATRNAVE